MKLNELLKTLERRVMIDMNEGTSLGLIVSLRQECERLNNLNKDLIRLDDDTWINKSQAKPMDFEKAEKYKRKNKQNA